MTRPAIQRTVGFCPDLKSRLRVRTAWAAVAAAGLSAAVLIQSHLLAQPVGPGLQPQLIDGEDGLVDGKEHTEFVFVRDSASAQEKFALAQKMERLKEWNKSADLYQEVLEKYRDRVIPSAKDSNNVWNRYTSVTWGVLGQLANWPQEGLDVYRGRYEPRAAELLASYKGDDLGPLYEALRKYFVTESGKQAGIQLIDANLERGEYAAAAEIGDQLLSLYPKQNLLVERPGIIFRTSLAHALTGTRDGQRKGEEWSAVLVSESPQVMGVVRGKDVVLADTLKAELEGLRGGGAAAAVTAAGDSWPTFGGGPTRNALSAAKAKAGTRLYSIPLAAPNFSALPNPQVRQQAQQQMANAAASGQTIGVMPVIDRGEMFVNDGSRIYAVNLESGVPLAGWLQTHPSSGGQYILPGVVGSTRLYQQTLTVTDRYLLAVMGQKDASLMMYGVAPQGDTRLVCLDRATGREVWVVSLPTTPDVPKNDDEKAIRALALSGAPLAVGDSVLTVGRSARSNQGEDCYVLSFDINTGKFRWACYVASSGMPANMYGAPQISDKTSHLAYANGRVYVLTNLGAVAALDAYSGTIVWLNIYPVDMPQRGRFNAFMGRGQQPSSGGARLKPWQFNPVMIADGKIFAMPDDGKNLLIYDATSGKDIKRISLDGLASWNSSGAAEREKPITLVGISGPRLVLASETRLLCINWEAYDEQTWPGPDDGMIFWPSAVSGKLMGRPFMTADAVYVSADDRLRRLSLQSGNNTGHDYPAWPRTWEDGESPGNVIVGGDHVILAGADSVDVYTDLALATAKLDKELTAAPTDPEPRLRYAEVMFAAGQGDDALKRLDEAIKLMGGQDKLTPGGNRDRLFNDALTFAQRSAPDERPAARDLVAKYFDRAGKAAGNPQQQVQYRVARAQFTEQRQKDPAGALALYQQILASAETRSVTLLDEKSSVPAQADDVAEKAIDRLVKEAGSEIYQPYEQKAAGEAAQAEDETEDLVKAGMLLEVAQSYPNSTVAPKAMLSAAGAFESAEHPRDAVRVLRQMWFKDQSGPNRVSILEGIARNYLAVPDRNRADMASTAAARLAMAAALPGDQKLSKDLKLPDGKVVAQAGATFTEALEEVRKVSVAEAGKSLPDFRLPIPAAGQKPYPQAFLPRTDEMVLPDAITLVLPARDFSRPDRVITWSPRNLSIFASDKGVPKKPICQSNAFPDSGRGVDVDAPRGVAWAGDVAIVWGGGRAVAVDGASGKTVWSIDLAKMPGLEVVRGGDAPGVAAPGGDGVVIDGNNIIINGRVAGPVIVRNGQIIRGGAAAAPAAEANPVANIAPALPPPPIAGLGEQVADVRPVGDRVLLTSSSGRLLSADLAEGKVNWQSRLAEKTPDRVVATEDFTVVRVRDDLKVQLFALDTYSGRIIGNKAFATQSGSVPVNMALSTDGTLVYTLPDRLILCDLYKGWDEDEKVITSSAGPGQPPQPIYAGAGQPGQLVIAEGRILAVADSINITGLSPNEKYIRVHSLETGQPLSLKYTIDGNNKRELDQVLTAGTKDWNVMMRTFGSKVYVIGPKTVYGYNLEWPSETWRGSTDIFDAGPNGMNFRDGFVGTTHLVILDQPTPPAENVKPQYRLHAFARYPSAQTKGESGKLDFSVTISDAGGLAPQWQAANGGFFYATSDGKVKMLVGTDTER